MDLINKKCRICQEGFKIDEDVVREKIPPWTNKFWLFHRQCHEDPRAIRKNPAHPSDNEIVIDVFPPKKAEAKSTEEIHPPTPSPSIEDYIEQATESARATLADPSDIVNGVGQPQDTEPVDRGVELAGNRYRVLEPEAFERWKVKTHFKEKVETLIQKGVIAPIGKEAP